ncbi:MAG: hypothetical protein WBY53_03275 [Acidobacteriaceae bacterium]
MALQPNPILWDSLLDAEMNACYWTKLSRRFLRNNRILKGFTAVTASGTAIAAWSIWSLHPGWWKALATLSCLASVYQTTIMPEDRIKKSAALAATWKELAIRYQLLWEQDRDLLDVATKADFSTMRVREAKIDETEFGEYTKLLVQARDEVLKARGLM